MVIFHSYVSLPEGNLKFGCNIIKNEGFSHEIDGFFVTSLHLKNPIESQKSVQKPTKFKGLRLGMIN